MDIIEFKENLNDHKLLIKIFWMNRPNIEESLFYYQPKYDFTGENLLYRYIESDSSFSARKKHLLLEKG